MLTEFFMKKSLAVFAFIVAGISCAHSQSDLTDSSPVTIPDNCPENMQKVVESLNEGFIYDFPEIIDKENVKNETIDLSHLRKEELAFYRSYNGSYFPENLLSKPVVCRNTYKISLSYIENGIRYYKYGLDGMDISGGSSDHSFFYSACHESIRITDLFSVEKLIGGWKKIGVFPDGKDVFEKAVELRKRESSNCVKVDFNEDELRQFLINFFIELGNGNYAEAEKYVDEKGLKSFKDKIEVIQASELQNTISYWGRMIPEAGKFSLYANVYFSEDPDLIKREFGDGILLEFRYNGYDYFSLVVIKTDSGFKIAGSRYEFSEL